MAGSTELPGESEFILGSITTPPTPLKDSSTFLPTSTPTTPKKHATTFIVTPTKEQFLPEKYLRGMYMGGGVDGLGCRLFCLMNCDIYMYVNKMC